MIGFSAKEPFELLIPVRPDDIDELNHVSNIVYVRWIQDAAVAHWFGQASEEHKEKIAWLVARHEIDYKRSAGPNDTIIARTWVGKAIQNFFERHTEMFRQSDMKMLAKARSLWRPVDKETLKPIHVGPEIYEQWSVSQGEIQSE